MGCEGFCGGGMLKLQQVQNFKVYLENLHVWAPFQGTLKLCTWSACIIFLCGDSFVRKGSSPIQHN
jgi:hypothetical protein